MPPDTSKLDDAASLKLIKAINLCETKRECLETSVIDAALHIFGSKDVFICSAWNPKESQTSPFYQTELEKLKRKDKFKNVRLIVLPLCDGSHFNGYIVDIHSTTIVFIDSMYPRKTGRRSVGTYLADTFFPGRNVSFLEFYDKRYQFDVHSCGAWLVLGMAGYIIGIKGGNSRCTLENAFSLLMTLVENIPISEKLEKIKNIFGIDERIESERVDYNFQDDESYMEYENTLKLKETKVEDEDEVDDTNYEEFIKSLKSK